MKRGIITISENGVVGIPAAPVWMTQFEIADLFGGAVRCSQGDSCHL